MGALNEIRMEYKSQGDREGTNGNDYLLGSGYSNTLKGYDGDDIMDGAERYDPNDFEQGIPQSHDTLIGGRGNDTYNVRESWIYVSWVPFIQKSGVTEIVENKNEGIDTAKSWVLDYTLAANVEKLELVGRGNQNGTGNELNNAITGNGGNNTLSGMDGNDRIWGGAGADTLDGGNGSDWLDGGYGRDILTGGAGKDSFVFGANFAVDNKLGRSANTYLNASSDIVKDFNRADDKILLSKAAFGLAEKVGSGLDTKTFLLGKAATTADQHIIYDKDSGQLWFDADGSGKVDKVLIATFDNKADIQLSDFQMIA